MNDVTSDTIQKILDISKPEMHLVEDVHGIETTFSTKQLHQVKAAPPEMPCGVDVVTLSGIKDLVLAKLETANFPSRYLIHVEDETKVVLKAKDCDGFGRRQVLITAQPVPFQQFRFGQWMGHEEFAIAIASLFADGGDKEYVLQMASSITNDETTSTDDDGFTQRGTIKKGMRLPARVDIKPRVALAPYRTFPEIEQPISQFVFRAKCEGGDTKPMLMLIEADGGRWKVDAISKISEALKAFELGIPIIA